jgi:hypothetical protein
MTLLFRPNGARQKTNRSKGHISVRLREFLFPPQSDYWLTIFRVGLGLEVLLYAISSQRDWMALYSVGKRSLISRDLAEAVLAADSPLIPRLGWLVQAGSLLGLSEPVVLYTTWIALVCAASLLVLGLSCRTAAIATWFLHLAAVKSGTFFAYGVDNFTSIGLFYLVLAPLPDHFSLDGWRRRRPGKDPRLHGFFRRVLQLHLCLIYFFGGLTKSVGWGWWNGASLWRALIRPPFDVVSPEMLLAGRHFLPLLGVCVCVIETTYPVFIYWKKTRLLWLFVVCAMHAMIGLTMRLHLFALIMIVLNLAAFAPAWHPGIFSARAKKNNHTGPEENGGATVEAG